MRRHLFNNDLSNQDFLDQTDIKLAAMQIKDPEKRAALLKDKIAEVRAATAANEQISAPLNAIWKKNLDSLAKTDKEFCSLFESLIHETPTMTHDPLTWTINGFNMTFKKDGKRACQINIGPASMESQAPIGGVLLKRVVNADRQIVQVEDEAIRNLRIGRLSISIFPQDSSMPRGKVADVALLKSLIDLDGLAALMPETPTP